MGDFRFAFFAMGSQCAITLQSDSEVVAEGVARAAEAEVRRIEAKYSRYQPESELSRLNAAAAVGADASIDAETRSLIVFAQACHAKSEGAFDITSGLLRQVWDFKGARLPDREAVAALLPRIGLEKLGLAETGVFFARAGMELDFGGIGKEYAADRAADVCRALGVEGGLVDLGGDIRVIGPRADGGPWRIGVRDPHNPARAIAEFALHEGALATSGQYERYLTVDGRRYGHILDPRTGWPSEGVCSATVVADRCLVAGSLATSAMVMGAAGSDWLQHLGMRYLVIDDRGALRGAELPMS